MTGCPDEHTFLLHGHNASERQVVCTICNVNVQEFGRNGSLGAILKPAVRYAAGVAYELHMTVANRFLDTELQRSTDLTFIKPIYRLEIGFAFLIQSEQHQLLKNWGCRTREWGYMLCFAILLREKTK